MASREGWKGLGQTERKNQIFVYVTVRTTKPHQRPAVLTSDHGNIPAPVDPINHEI